MACGEKLFDYNTNGTFQHVYEYKNKEVNVEMGNKFTIYQDELIYETNRDGRVWYDTQRGFR